MKVAVVGAGNMGRAIGSRAIAGGHEVEILDRDPSEAASLAEELGARSLPLDAPFTGEVVVFALYYPGIKDAVNQYADRLAGRVVVDITNPVDTQTWDRLATAPGTSSAEEVQQLVPEGARVVKAFNTTFARTLVEGEVDGQRLDALLPETTSRRSRRSPNSSPMVDCGRSTPAHSVARRSLSTSGFSTSRSRNHAASATPARSGCTPEQSASSGRTRSAGVIRHRSQVADTKRPRDLRDQRSGSAAARPGRRAPSESSSSACSIRRGSSDLARRTCRTGLAWGL
jgi:predicted dinucleotide-binding enzyme